LSKGTKRVSVALPLSFQDALETIYKVIGCAAVAWKPTISYKLLTTTQKAKPIDLYIDMDWNGCLEDVATAEVKQKGQLVPILIVILDQVCIVIHVYSQVCSLPMLT
jgi:hypothetical protein